MGMLLECNRSHEEKEPKLSMDARKTLFHRKRVRQRLMNGLAYKTIFKTDKT